MQKYCSIFITSGGAKINKNKQKKIGERSLTLVYNRMVSCPLPTQQTISLELVYSCWSNAPAASVSLLTPSTLLIECEIRAPRSLFQMKCLRFSCVCVRIFLLLCSLCPGCGRLLLLLLFSETPKRTHFLGTADFVIVSLALVCNFFYFFQQQNQIYFVYSI